MISPAKDYRFEFLSALVKYFDIYLNAYFVYYILSFHFNNLIRQSNNLI